MPPREWAPYPAPDDRSQHTVTGSLRVLRGLEGPKAGHRRDVYAYLPPSYSEGTRRYPVIYMQDGQNLFDRAISYGAEWQVDEAMEALSRRGVEAIVVGIANRGGERLNEYGPFEDPQHGGGGGAAYADFLATELKAVVDAEFRTLPGREHTSVAGSSMGGLISLFAFFRQPEVFGAVAAMSASFWFANRAIFPFLEAAPRVPGRIYLDVGTREGMRTVRDVRRVRDLLHDKGYDVEHELLYVEEREAGHEEAAWARRFPRVAAFLLRAEAAVEVAGRAE